MSAIRRLLARLGIADRTRPDDASSPPRPTDLRPDAGADLDLFVRAGDPDGPDAASLLSALRSARGSAREEPALRALAARRRRLPDPVLGACAELLAARGEREAALAMIAHATSPATLVLRSDLLADRGDVAGALAAVERAIALDVDVPGGLERHARCRERLGLPVRPAPAGGLDGPTIAPAWPVRAPYRIRREVARGGAGTVYEAEDDVLGRTVAFKVYHRREADRDQLVREASIAAALRGPGVVRVLDASPDEGWITLEWAARGTLRDALRRSPPPGTAWIRPLASALGRVHAAGFVHGDVKPGNLLFRDDGEPVLSDFGVARRAGEPADRGGTAGFVSPERLRGAPSDPRDDIYAFGRVVEDLARVAPTEDDARWKAVVARCLGGADDRPSGGNEVLSILP